MGNSNSGGATRECAICCAYAVPEGERGIGVHEIRHDPVRDGLEVRAVYACEECYREIRRSSSGGARRNLAATDAASLIVRHMEEHEPPPWGWEEDFRRIIAVSARSLLAENARLREALKNIAGRECYCAEKPEPNCVACLARAALKGGRP